MEVHVLGLLHRDTRYFNTLPEWTAPQIKGGVYYKQLKSDFADTAYYQDILRECGYFQTWQQKN